ADAGLNAALGLDDVGDLNARRAASAARAKKFEEQQEAAASEIESTQERMRELKPPPLQELPPPPQPKNRSPEEAFGSIAMIMAMAGSLMTRRPLVNSLNAGAEVMKAFQAGDQAAAKEAIETWHTNVENAKQLHQFQMDAYEEALKGID